ncbi:MAG: outer membrane protein assembly factor BamD [Deltaproteobacteria bacterium]|nr:outer membrane protein assembly factor BamD [Deltaproteobacteria bacterium]
MRILALLLTAAMLMTLSACSARDPDIDKPAHELAQNGMDEYAEKDYRKSIRYFEKLRDWYPFSKFAKLAELKIADAHFNLKEYDDAIFAYQEFEELHPKNEAIPYVIYQIGISHFNQLGTIDRDQTAAHKAIDSFERLIRNYPDDLHADDARQKISLCRKSLAENQFYIGRFYYRSKRYKSALARFEGIVANWNDFPEIQEKARQLIPLCQAALAEQTGIQAKPPKSTN